MIIKRLFTLQVLLLLGLGGVLLLPRHTGLGPAGIAMALPHTFDGWQRHGRAHQARGTQGARARHAVSCGSSTAAARTRYTSPSCSAARTWSTASTGPSAASPRRAGRSSTRPAWRCRSRAGVAPVEVTRLTDVREWRNARGQDRPAHEPELLLVHRFQGYHGLALDAHVHRRQGPRAARREPALGLRDRVRLRHRQPPARRPERRRRRRR